MLKFIRWLLNSEPSKNLTPQHGEVAAHHEAGHIVYSYFVQWASKRVILNVSNNIVVNAVTTYDFLDDDKLVQALGNPGLISTLSRIEQSRIYSIILKRCTSLLGGPIAEAYFLQGISFEGVIEIDFRGPDAVHAFRLEAIANRLFGTKNLVNEKLIELATITRLPVFWNSITLLANRIITAKGFQLNQSEIENTLIKSGLLSYINSIHDNT